MKRWLLLLVVASCSLFRGPLAELDEATAQADRAIAQVEQLYDEALVAAPDQAARTAVEARFEPVFVAHRRLRRAWMLARLKPTPERLFDLELALETFLVAVDNLLSER